ncbi:hypothetical protein [Pseudoroseicyclus aestuarii]|uniref:Uncharacterized protein n=1 Tax=Pseudoroseicyclus aestuarii TaxID=1795041 RepID=A0A318T420_9RHOB|nr:hypothetical protein [Pseudoroseicyclus aestuarii]PYE85014.1 hypothetical protein DFP88_102819 [Pseudoroseicyclus aestuarii]
MRLVALIPLAALPLLAACATPQDSCISSVTRQGRVLESLVNETRGNLARGYAIDERQEVRNQRRLCRARNSEGEIVSGFCNRPVVTTRREAEAINLEEERAVLEQLLLRQEQQRAAEAAAIAQCRARYPQA